MTVRPARVVLVDSGVDLDHPGIGDQLDVEQVVRTTAAGELVEEPVVRDALGHGTAVAATIVAHTGRLPVSIVRVFDHEPRCSTQQLLAALQFAAGQAPALVNLSLGILDDSAVEALTEALGRLRQRGCRIVAPLTANGVPCLPGSLAEVDGVVADPSCQRGSPGHQAHGSRTVWRASPEPPPRVPGLPAAFVRGESLAVAEVTAHLWNLAQQSPGP